MRSVATWRGSHSIVDSPMGLLLLTGKNGDTVAVRGVSARIGGEGEISFPNALEQLARGGALTGLTSIGP